MGHFTLARLFKVKVERFFLFFDLWFHLFKKKIGDTTYGIGWLPLGGYVKIYGMFENHNHKSYNKNNNLKFYYKSSIKRFLIISGGIIFNFIFSLFIFSYLLYKYGDYDITLNSVNKYGIEVNNLGEKIGFKNGDKILYIDNKYVPYFNEIIQKIIFSNKITINREGKIKNILLNDNKKKYLFNRNEEKYFITPRIPIIIDYIKNSKYNKEILKSGDKIISINNNHVNFFDQLRDKIDKILKNKNKIISLGIYRNGIISEKKITLKQYNNIFFKEFIQMNNIFSFKKNKYNILDSINIGLIRLYEIIKNQILYLKNIINTNSYKQIGSFLSVSREFSGKWNWILFWSLTGALSIWIAFLNLLPIPSLDGGHLFFIILEMFLGRNISEKISQKCNIIGFIILSLIMISIVIWDIIKIFIY